VRLCGGGLLGSGVRVSEDGAFCLCGSDSPYGGSRNAAPVTGAASRDCGASCRRGGAFERSGCARGWSIEFNIFLRFFERLGAHPASREGGTTRPLEPHGSCGG